MVKAIWNGVVLAQSNDTVVVEGNHYFPPEAVNQDYFKDSSYHTTCSWKGLASYYSVEVEGKRNDNAAWYYPAPRDAARHVTGRVAFWKGVQVIEE